MAGFAVKTPTDLDAAIQGTVSPAKKLGARVDAHIQRSVGHQGQAGLYSHGVNADATGACRETMRTVSGERRVLLPGVVQQFAQPLGGKAV